MSLKAHDDRDEPGPLAKAVMAASALAVAALLAYMVHQAIVAPSAGEPSVEIVSTAPTEQGDLRVEVAVTNQGERGQRAIVVEVDCEEPPPELTITNIPAQGQRRGYFVCPPDATNITASISAYEPS